MPETDQLRSLKVVDLDGRGERIRTSDPLVPNQVLYQAEPLPDLLLDGCLPNGTPGLFRTRSKLS
jgi:hypothetical protein